MKKVIAAFVVLFLVTMLGVACARPRTEPSNTASVVTPQAGSSGGTSQGSSSGGASQGSSSGGASQGSNSGGASQGSKSTNVHLGQTNFTQSSVTISKGSSINLIDDAAVVHIIANGTWANNTPKSGAEAGAPTVNKLQFNSAGQSKTIGPFNTAGTFHLYCSVHQGMNLTVKVQ